MTRPGLALVALGSWLRSFGSAAGTEEPAYSNTLTGFELHWDWETAAAGWAADPDQPAIAAGLRALSAGYGCEAVLGGCGGSIPLVHVLQQALDGARCYYFRLRTLRHQCPWLQ